MPRVPIFDGVPTANLAPASAPQIQAPRSVPAPGDPGEGFQQAGQAMMGLGQQVARQQEEERQKLASAMAKSGYNQLRSFAEKQKNGLAGHQLYSALDASKSVMDAMRKEHERILNGITDEDAKEAYKATADGYLISFQSDVDDYARKERTKFEAAESEVNQGWMENDAVESWVKEYEARAHQDPTKIGPPLPPINGEQFMRSALANANDRADAAGLPPDSAVRKAMIDESRSRVNGRVVSSLLDRGDIENAKKHLADSMQSGLIDEKTATAAAKMIAQKEQDDGDLRSAFALRDSGAPLWQQRQALDEAFKSGAIDARAHKARLDLIEREAKAADEAKKSFGASVLRNVESQLISGVPIEKISIEDRNALVALGQWDAAVAFARDKVYPDDGFAMEQIKLMDSKGILRGVSQDTFDSMFKTRLDPRNYAIASAMLAKANDKASVDQMDLLSADELLFQYATKFKVPGVAVTKEFSRRNVAYRDYELRMEELWTQKQRGLGRKGTLDDFREFLSSTLAESEYVKDEKNALAIGYEDDPADYGEAWVVDPDYPNRELKLRTISKSARNAAIDKIIAQRLPVTWQNIVMQWSLDGRPDPGREAEEQKIAAENAAIDNKQRLIIERDPFGVTSWEQARRISGMTSEELSQSLRGIFGGIVYDHGADGRSLFGANPPSPSGVRNDAMQEILAKRGQKK